jgi:hypothetical protein
MAPIRDHDMSRLRSKSRTSVLSRSLARSGEGMRVMGPCGSLTTIG